MRLRWAFFKSTEHISTAAQSSNRLRTLAAVSSRRSTVPPIPNSLIDLILLRRFSFLRCSMFLRSRFSFGVIAMVIRCSLPKQTTVPVRVLIIAATDDDKNSKRQNYPAPPRHDCLPRLSDSHSAFTFVIPKRCCCSGFRPYLIASSSDPATQREFPA